MLHRVTCGNICKPIPHRGAEQFTGGKYSKLCASHHEGITNWVKEEIPGSLSFTHLCKRCRPEAPIDDVMKLRDAFIRKTVEAQRDNAIARRERLARANPKPAVRFVMTRVFDRNPDVVAQVLIRAHGNCEGCGQYAPFNSKATREPYLEVHHVVKLAENGDDTVENAIALFPNCHRHRHYG
jgi:hypothetical protein